MADQEANNLTFDPETLRFYSNEAPVYSASGPQGASRHLASFLDLLEPGARILELCCGGGRDAEAMIRRGFAVDPTDGTPEIARKAAERLERPVRVMRFDELHERDRYDAVWAHASLLHVPRVALTSVLQSIYRALRPGGFHFASFKSGDGEGRDRFGRYFNYLDKPALLGIYQAAAPWEIVAIDEYMGGGYEGSETPWIALTVRKSPTAQTANQSAGV